MISKRCSRCKEEKQISEFDRKRKDSDKRASLCKSCRREVINDWYQRNKARHKARTKVTNRKNRERILAQLLAYLQSHPCVDCGETDPVVLEFDHIDMSKKSTDVSKLLQRHTDWDKIQPEITKCEIRCANCHKRRTAKQLGWYKGMAQPMDGVVTTNHLRA